MSNGKVRTVVIKFPPSNSPDVVSYNLYMAETPDPVDYNSTKYDLGMPTANAEGKMEVDLSTVCPGVDGTYNVGVTAVDDVGNESSMSTKDNVPLDFVAPDAPGPVEVTKT